MIKVRSDYSGLCTLQKRDFFRLGLLATKSDIKSFVYQVLGIKTFLAKFN
jgi:hypothetical protein